MSEVHKIKYVKQPDCVVEVGWDFPFYYWRRYNPNDVYTMLESRIDCVTVSDLIADTWGLIEWDKEQETIAKLLGDPNLDADDDIFEMINRAMGMASR